MSRLVLLDNEAVRALRDPANPRHRRVLIHVQALVIRKRRADAIGITVPTAVRVEAGWDRTSAAWVFPSQLRIADAPLDASSASAAAAIHVLTSVSVADAHLAAVMQSGQHDHITVITSDPRDMRRLAEDADADVTIITI